MDAVSVYVTLVVVVPLLARLADPAWTVGDKQAFFQGFLVIDTFECSFILAIDDPHVLCVGDLRATARTIHEDAITHLGTPFQCTITELAFKGLERRNLINRGIPEGFPIFIII
jgi:hypothetical protein